MAADFQVTGADQFLRLSKALKAAGRKEMRKTLNAGMRNGAKPLIPLMKQAALDELPSGGGLNKTVAKRPVRAVTRTGASAGVKIIMAKTQPGYNVGVIRHPVHEGDKAGRKGAKERGDKPTPWVTQRIGPGHWFDETATENLHKVLPALERAIEDALQEIIQTAKRR